MTPKGGIGRAAANSLRFISGCIFKEARPRDRGLLLAQEFVLFVPRLPVVWPSVVTSGIPVGVVVRIELIRVVVQLIFAVLAVVIWI